VQYVGLCAELPFTIIRNDTDGTDIVSLVLETADVKTYPGYSGHEVLVILHTQREEKWEGSIIARSRLLDSDDVHLSLDLAGKEALLFLSICVRVDTTAPAGLYDDFIIKCLYLRSPNNKYYASFRFRPLQRWKGLLVMERGQ